MNTQEMLMMQLYGGGLLGSGSTWLKVVFLAFLLAIPVFRPERIRILSMYRRAYLCFGLSIIVPSAASSLFAALLSPGGTAGGFGGGSLPSFGGRELLQLAGAAGPVLFGVSVIFALAAVVPGFIPPQSSRPTSRGLDGDSSKSSDDSPADGFSSESGSA